MKREAERKRIQSQIAALQKDKKNKANQKKLKSIKALPGFLLALPLPRHRRAQAKYGMPLRDHSKVPGGGVASETFKLESRLLQKL